MMNDFLGCLFFLSQYLFIELIVGIAEILSSGIFQEGQILVSCIFQQFCIHFASCLNDTVAIVNG